VAAHPRSKLAAGPLSALKTRAAEKGATALEELAGSKALKADVRSVEAACRLGGAKRVKIETVERLCRKVLGTDPHSLYGEEFDQAWQHRGKRVNERVQAFDHCFSSPKSVSLLAAGGGRDVRRLLAEGRDEALQVAIGYLERHGLGVRRDHNGVDRYEAVGGLVAVAFEHRMSRAGDPNNHTHVLVQNAAQGPDGRWTALDSDRLYAHLMAADHLYLAAERAALTQRLGVRWGPVDERSGAAEIQGLDDRTLIERFSKRSEELLPLPVTLSLCWWIVGLLAAGRGVRVAGPSVKRLGHPPLAHRARPARSPGALGIRNGCRCPLTPSTPSPKVAGVGVIVGATGSGGSLGVPAVGSAGPLVYQPLSAFGAVSDRGYPPLRGQPALGIQLHHGAVAERLDLLGPAQPHPLLRMRATPGGELT
jgi:TrwC relaxase